MLKVAIAIKWISHYRKSFYEELNHCLNSNGAELCLLYGEPVNEEERQKKDWVNIPWGIQADNIRLGIASKSVLWQPVVNQIRGFDLVIVEHASKLLLNYLLLAYRPFTKTKVAFWGHGKNFQSRNSNSIEERWKRFTLRWADWWFAYTTLCAEGIIQAGFPAQRITCVENAVDTKALMRDRKSITEKEVYDFRLRHHMTGRNMGIFCGGMYADKRLAFLIDAAKHVRCKIPDFELIFIGSGPDQIIVEQACKDYSWMHYLGGLFGREKALAMMTADVYLMPGLIGLGVLDAFAMDLPVITTNFPYHSPEIEYVHDKVNGIMAKNDLVSFAESVVLALHDKSFHEELKVGCQRTADHYTIENMAQNFADGILQCLAYYQ